MKRCLLCKKEVKKRVSQRPSAFAKQKFCSKACVALDFKRRGIAPPSRKGARHTDAAKLKNRLAHLGKPAKFVPPVRRGADHHAWKGGVTKLAEKIRKHYEYRQWRSDVFTRDDFTCQECGERCCALNADHIKPFAKILSEYKILSIEEAMACAELWDINNGRTLCVPCHKATPTYLNRWT